MKALYISNKTNIKKIKKKIKKYRDIEMIVTSNSIKENKDFIEELKLLNIPIVDGRWVFKLLIIQVIKYIVKIQNREMYNIELTFIANDYTDLIHYYITHLIDKVKSLKIITNERWKFEKIENELFKEEGNILLITNNKRKAFKNTDIAINFDFNSEQINSFNINRTVVINLKEKIDIKSKRFNGININFYDIIFDNKIIKIFDWLKDFKNVEIYESYLYKNTSIKNLMDTINNDKVEIKYLIGNNGTIDEKEYLNILDKRYNLS